MRGTKIELVLAAAVVALLGGLLQLLPAGGEMALQRIGGSGLVQGLRLSHNCTEADQKARVLHVGPLQVCPLCL